MSEPYVSQPLSEARPFHVEETAADEPFSAELAQEASRLLNGLYEHLSDQAVPGNSHAASPGHAHGRTSLDGTYLRRHGSFQTGHLYLQTTQSVEPVPACFELLNLGRPVGGTETPMTRVVTESPAIYLDSDYARLEWSILLAVAGGGVARARLHLLDGAETLAWQEVTTDSTDLTCLTFRLELDPEPAFRGWKNLLLTFATSDAALPATLAGADVRFKPTDPVPGSGDGLLIGGDA